MGPEVKSGIRRTGAYEAWTLQRHAGTGARRRGGRAGKGASVWFGAGGCPVRLRQTLAVAPANRTSPGGVDPVLSTGWPQFAQIGR